MLVSIGTSINVENVAIPVSKYIKYIDNNGNVTNIYIHIMAHIYMNGPTIHYLQSSKKARHM